MTTAPAIAITPQARAALAAVCRVRTAIAALPAAERCNPKCPTWIVSHNGRRYKIERCDECWSGCAIDRVVLSDEDVALLPEAQAELRRYRYGNGAR